MISYHTLLSCSRGITMSKEGHLIVTDWSNHCTIIDTASGEVINRFGKQGSGKAEFLYPNRVALTQDGHIVVVDTRIIAYKC